MTKIVSLALAGLTAAGLTLATPAESQAQSFGFNLNFGRGGVGVYSGRPYDYDCDYGYGPYSQTYRYGGYGNYGRYGNYGYRDYGGYRDYIFRDRPVIVHPESYHWTPGRGWHSHGHIHVPHRGHYHTRPY